MLDLYNSETGFLIGKVVLTACNIVSFLCLQSVWIDCHGLLPYHTV